MTRIIGRIDAVKLKEQTGQKEYKTQEDRENVRITNDGILQVNIIITRTQSEKQEVNNQQHNKNGIITRNRDNWISTESEK